MTAGGFHGGVRVFEALTGEEVLERIESAVIRLMAQVRSLPEFRHPVAFPEVDFQILMKLSTYPQDEREWAQLQTEHITQVDARDKPAPHAPAIEREIVEEFATGAEPQVERADGTIRRNSAPDEIRAELGRPLPMLQRVSSGELVTHSDAGLPSADEVERAPVHETPRDPRHSEDPQVPANPYGPGVPGGTPRGAKVDRGGPALTQGLKAE